MAITTMAALRAAKPGQTLRFEKAAIAIDPTKGYNSLWTVGTLPAAGSAPGSVNGAIATSATTGALAFTNAGAGQVTELARTVMVNAGAPIVAMLIVYDRLWHSSGLVGNSTTTQSFTMPALTRATSGVGVELWLETYANLGAVATTATATYTNTAGTSGRTATCAIVASTLAGVTNPFALAGSDAGLQSVQSVILSVSTGTAGNWGLTLLKRVGEIPIRGFAAQSVLDGFDFGFPRIENNACLAMMAGCPLATSSPTMRGSLMLTQG